MKPGRTGGYKVAMRIPLQFLGKTWAAGSYRMQRNDAEAKKWLKENCIAEYRWDGAGGFLYFASDRDAMLFKLTCC